LLLLGMHMTGGEGKDREQWKTIIQVLLNIPKD